MTSNASDAGSILSLQMVRLDGLAPHARRSQRPPHRASTIISHWRPTPTSLKVGSRQAAASAGSQPYNMHVNMFASICHTYTSRDVALYKARYSMAAGRQASAHVMCACCARKRAHTCTGSGEGEGEHKSSRDASISPCGDGDVYTQDGLFFTHAITACDRRL